MEDDISLTDLIVVSITPFLYMWFILNMPYVMSITAVLVGTAHIFDFIIADYELNIIQSSLRYNNLFLIVFILSLIVEFLFTHSFLLPESGSAFIYIIPFVAVFIRNDLKQFCSIAYDIWSVFFSLIILSTPIIGFKIYRNGFSYLSLILSGGGAAFSLDSIFLLSSKVFWSIGVLVATILIVKNTLQYSIKMFQHVQNLFLYESNSRLEISILENEEVKNIKIGYLVGLLIPTILYVYNKMSSTNPVTYITEGEGDSISVNIPSELSIEALLTLSSTNRWAFLFILPDNVGECPFLNE